MMSNNLLANTNHGRKRDVKMMIEKIILGKKNEEIFDGKMPWNMITDAHLYKPFTDKPFPNEQKSLPKSAYVELGVDDQCFDIVISPDPDKIVNGSYRITIDNNDILDRLKSIIGITEYGLNAKTRTDRDLQNQKVMKHMLELCNSKSIDKSVTNSYEDFIENLRTVIQKITDVDIKDIKS